MRAALLDVDETVVNVIELPDDWHSADETAWQAPDGHQVVEIPDGLPVGPGWSYDGEFEAPTAPDPEPPAPPRPSVEELQVLIDGLQAQVDEITDMMLEEG